MIPPYESGIWGDVCSGKENAFPVGEGVSLSKKPGSEMQSLTPLPGRGWRGVSRDGSGMAAEPI